MSTLISDPRLRRILSLPDETTEGWAVDLDRFDRGDITLTRQSAGEGSIKAVQRLLIFLGYSTASTGAFLIDGDFGRGTNRAVAQFQLEHDLTNFISRGDLCYPCTWQSASQKIVSIPDSKLTPMTLAKMLEVAHGMIDRRAVLCGSVEEATFHLDALHRRRLLSCGEIRTRYGKFVDDAIASVAVEGIEISHFWPLAIIKQETSGIVRPRFEQHLLSRLNATQKKVEFAELRHRSMSMGLGQILGDNFRVVKAASARAMYSSTVAEQIAQIARFLTSNAKIVSIVKRDDPREEDFRAVAKFYNGPGYEKHHYHESLARWFREFKVLAGA
jgi:hypothetical protein